MDDQALDEHQADIGLAEAHAVTEEGTAVAVCPLQQRVVALPLIGCKDLVNGRMVSLPFRGRQFMALEEFVQRFSVDVKGRVIVDMSLDHLQQIGCHVLCALPMCFEPLLQDRNRTSRYLHVQLHVLGQSGEGKVGRADQGRGAHYLQACMGDVGFGVKLVLSVDAAADLSAPQRIDHGSHPVEEIALSLLGLDAVVQTLRDLGKTLVEGLLRSPADLVAHQNTHPVDLLPLSVQREQCADLEIARGDVD